MGRPRIYGPDNIYRLHVMMTPREGAELKRLAEAADMTASELVRHWIASFTKIGRPSKKLRRK